MNVSSVKEKQPSLVTSQGSLRDQNPPVEKESDVKFHAPVNPLHPKISVYILHTVFYTFPKVLTRRICLTIKKFFV